MGTIRVHEFISLDGVIDTPSWTAGFGFDPAMGAAIGAIVAGCDAILLGRTTYDMFAPAWSARTAEDDPGAPFFNDTAKYVVSSTLTEATWQNSRILPGYDAAQIADLAARCAGLYISGSAMLVRALLADGLVGELHLFRYPVTRGGGPRLFDASLPARTWAQTAGEMYANGVTYQCLTPAA